MANEVESVRQLTSEIKGCISDAEGELLYRLAKDVPEGQAIVEVGRGKDKSTVWLAKGSEAGDKNKVYSIASHRGSPDHVKVDEENMHTEFILTKARVQDTVVSLHETSEEAAGRWKKKIGLLWINTSHEYEDVKRVFLCWQRYLSQDARVTIYDCSKPGPARAVREQVGDCGNFTSIRSVGATVVLALDRCRHHWIINSDEIGICKYCERKRNFKRLAREIASLEIRQRTKDRISKLRENHGEGRKK